MEKDVIIEEEGRGEIVLYQTPDGKTNLDVKLENSIRAGCAICG